MMKRGSIYYAFVLSSLYSSQAFQPLSPVTRADILQHSHPRQQQREQQQEFLFVLRANNNESNEESSSSSVRTAVTAAPMRPPPPPTTTQFASAVARRSDLDKGVAAQMDDKIFTFNKVLIDTIYELICFIYPVRGNDRDFARFFVLETVARVPYFAYLSVLHLRETFGERGLGDRMRTHYSEADNELHHVR
jgi:Alternative oxidase